MFKLLTSTLIAALLTASPLCQAAEQTRSVAEFKSIVTKGAFKLTVDVAQAQSIKLKGDAQYLDLIRTDVSGDELTISYRQHKGHISSDESAEVIIGAPLLNKFRMAGAGATEILHINGERFELVSEGAGMVKLGGKVKNLNLIAKGVGLVDAKGLTAQNAEVALNGLGAVEVRVKDQLNASVNGIGSLTYFGNPAHVNKSVNGLGRVSAAD